MATKDENKPYSTKPTTQVDLEAREKADYKSATVGDADPSKVSAPYAVEGNDTSAYVGVDPDKMTYANDTEAPLKGDGIEDKVADAMAGVESTKKQEPVKTTATSSTPPPTPPPTPASA